MTYGRLANIVYYDQTQADWIKEFREKVKDAEHNPQLKADLEYCAKQWRESKSSRSYRYRIVTLAAQGLNISVISQRLNIGRAVVTKWLQAFIEGGAQAIDDSFKHKKPHKLKRRRNNLPTMAELKNMPTVKRPRGRPPKRAVSSSTESTSTVSTSTEITCARTTQVTKRIERPRKANITAAEGVSNLQVASTNPSETEKVAIKIPQRQLRFSCEQLITNYAD